MTPAELRVLAGKPSIPLNTDDFPGGLVEDSHQRSGIFRTRHTGTAENARANAEIEPLDWHARCPGLCTRRRSASQEKAGDHDRRFDPIDADTLRIRHEFLAMPVRVD
jgi:hypothetical protein